MQHTQIVSHEEWIAARKRLLAKEKELTRPTDFYVPAAPLQSDQELRQEPRRIAIKQPSFTPPRIETEPERRLWKICAQAAPPRLGAAEWIALLLFGVSAICILACCVFEWLQLSNSGSLDQVVRALLTRYSQYLTECQLEFRCGTYLRVYRRMGGSFVESTLADGGDVDRVLLGVKENDPERFAVEKTHLRAQLGDCRGLSMVSDSRSSRKTTAPIRNELTSRRALERETKGRSS